MNNSPAIPDTAPDHSAAPRRVSPPISEDSASGTLVVSAGTGGKAYPLSGVRIEIYLPDEDGTPVLLRTQQTDESGLAEAVTIAAPDASASESPDADAPYLPYTTAQVRAFKPGYYPTEAVEVPIFAGIRTLQYFEMIPTAESAQADAPTGDFILVSQTLPDHL